MFFIEKAFIFASSGAIRFEVYNTQGSLMTERNFVLGVIALAYAAIEDRRMG